MLYSFKISVLLTALLLHTVTSKGGRTATKSNKAQTLLIPQTELNEQDYSDEDEGSVILEVPIAAGPRDLGALLALQATTTQRPHHDHHDHHEHHYHHHNRRPTRRPPKRRPRPCYDDDEDSDECDEHYYGRPSWQHTSHWYVAPPQPPPVASPQPSHYGPLPIYYPQPSYHPQQNYPQQQYPQQQYPQQYYPPPYYPSPYYPPPYYYNFPPWYFFNRTITG